MKLEAQDWEIAADEIATLATRFKQSVAEGFARVDNQIVTQFKDVQLSGRRAGDVGLNIGKGTLHLSIKSLVEVADDKIAGVVYNTGAPYWEYHQYAMGHNPKRLTFDEYFQEQGLAGYTKVVDDSLVEAFT